MGFQGSLDTVGLPDIFQLFSFGRKSGALHLTLGSDRGVVYFTEGEVYYATVAPTEGIGNLLVRADLVSPEQWKKVLNQSKGDPEACRQGEILLGLDDDVDSVAIEVFVRERIEDAVFKLAQWSDGDFVLEDEVHPFGPVFRFAVDSLLQVAERRLEEWRQITEVVPSVQMGVQVVRDLPEELDEVTISREEWRILAGISPGSSIDDVASGLGETEFRICRVLAALVDRDLVELMSEQKLAAIRTLLRTDNDAAGSTLQADPAGPVDTADVEPADNEGIAAEPAAESIAAEVAAAVQAEADAAVEEAPVEGSRPDEIDDSDTEASEAAGDGEPRKLSIAELAAQAESETADTEVESEPLTQAAVESLPDSTYGEPAEYAGVVPSHYDAEIQPAQYDAAAVLDQQVAAAPAAPTGYADPGHAHHTGEIPTVTPSPAPPPPPPPDLQAGQVQPGHVDYGAEPAAPEADRAEAGADGELDKSLILRLIAGVKSL